VLSLNPETLRVEPRPVLAFVKRTAPATLLRIRTRAGRSITVTPSHPLFTLEGGRLTTLAAREARVGTHIAVPRWLPTRGAKGSITPASLLHMFREQDQVYVPTSPPLRQWACLARRRHPTLRVWADATGVTVAQLRGLLGGQSVNAAVLARLTKHAEDAPPVGERLKSKGRGELRMPAVMTPELARFLGLLVAEGTTAASGSASTQRQPTRLSLPRCWKPTPQANGHSFRACSRVTPT
jgi:hypothetical protein